MPHPLLSSRLDRVPDFLLSEDHSVIQHVQAGATSQLPFSPAVVAGDLVYVSGLASVDPETGRIVVDTFEGEMRRSFDNLRRVLDAAGCSLMNVINIRCYVDKQERLTEFNEIYRDLVSPPYPARTTLIGVLGNEFLRFEVDAIAHRGAGS